MRGVWGSVWVLVRCDSVGFCDGGNVWNSRFIIKVMRWISWGRRLLHTNKLHHFSSLYAILLIDSYHLQSVFKLVDVVD